MYEIVVKNIKVIHRIAHEVPNDGVHVAGKDGKIKGVHSLWFDNKLVPKGQTAFYWRLEEDVGLRVSFSFGWLKPIGLATVTKEYDTMRALYDLGLCPKPHGIKQALVKGYYEHEKVKVNTRAYAIKVQHVHYLEDAWKKYAEGYPYDWGADNHPNHSPKGFMEFVAMAKEKAGKMIDTSYKLGDVSWCSKNKRWYLVDTGK